MVDMHGMFSACKSSINLYGHGICHVSLELVICFIVVMNSMVILVLGYAKCNKYGVDV